jgi:hypothetical protein
MATSVNKSGRNVSEEKKDVRTHWKTKLRLVSCVTFSWAAQIESQRKEGKISSEAVVQENVS